MVTKIALDAGHGINTPGKRTPDDEREWSFNNKVLLACWNKLLQYKDVDLIRLDDPTGKSDVPLVVRTNVANGRRADVLVSIHHNANAGRWGSHGGVETYTQPGSSKASVEIANLIQPRITKAMGLRDRGCKTKNLHMTRESNMPAVLTEGGFMDSTTDIKAMRNESLLRAQGEAIADALVLHFKLQPKVTTAPSKPIKPEVSYLEQELGKTQKDDMKSLLTKAYNSKVFSVDHTSKVDTMKRGEAYDLLLSYVARTTK